MVGTPALFCPRPSQYPYRRARGAEHRAALFVVIAPVFGDSSIRIAAMMRAVRSGVLRLNGGRNVMMYRNRRPTRTFGPPRPVPGVIPGVDDFMKVVRQS